MQLRLVTGSQQTICQVSQSIVQLTDHAQTQILVYLTVSELFRCKKGFPCTKIFCAPTPAVINRIYSRSSGYSTSSRVVFGAPYILFFRHRCSCTVHLSWQTRRQTCRCLDSDSYADRYENIQSC